MWSVRGWYGGGDALALGERLLEALGHEVIVANPRKLRAIYDNDSKSDQVDAEYLARIGRLDPKLLAGIEHRGRRRRHSWR
jgi:transposase